MSQFALLCPWEREAVSRNDKKTNQNHVITHAEIKREVQANQAPSYHVHHLSASQERAPSPPHPSAPWLRLPGV